MELISASDAENVQDRLTAQLGNLEASVSTAGVQSGVFGAKQRSILEDLKHKVSTVSQTVQTLVGSEDAVVRAPVPLLDMSEAVLFYWKKNIPQILLALLLDLMGLWFCALLMLSRNIPSARQQEMLQADQVTSSQSTSLFNNVSGNLS